MKMSRLDLLLSGSSIVICAIVLYTVQNMKKGKEKENNDEDKTIGKADLGGPFALINQDGVPVTDATFRDQFVLLYFGFTFCPDICPNEINKVTEVMNEIGDQNSFDTKPVFVTIDPNRDTIGQLKYYSQDFDPRFTWLTGPSSQIQEIAKSYRVFTGKVDEGEEDDGDYLVDHSSFMYLIDPSGECIDFYGKSQHVEDIARSINRHMRKYSGKGKGT